MGGLVNRTTEEGMGFAHAKVRLRKDLQTSLRESAGKPFLMLHDPLRGEYYRLGIHEWSVAQRLNGSATMKEVVASISSEDPERPQEQIAGEVFQLARWLVRSGLASSDVDLPHPAPDRWQQALHNSARLAKFNPLFVSVTLPPPGRIFARLTSCIGILFSRAFFFAWLALVSMGLLALVTHWERFANSFDEVFSIRNGAMLMLVWLTLKVLHELGHAAACQRLGGEVTRFGLVFILFSPIAWVDVTSSWSFRSKWSRICVSAAGMYVELLLAGVAALVFAVTNDPWIATMARNVVISASVSTLLFNMNFLMRFDGYYILADLLDIQNLYATGQQYLRSAGQRYLLGMDAPRPEVAPAKRWIVRAYAVAAAVWRVVFCVGILIVASHLLHGFGVLLALFSGLLWFGLPLARTASLLWRSAEPNRPNQRRLATLGTLCLATVLLTLCMPWPGATVAHGVVDFPQPTEDIDRQHGPTVRAASSGFVSRLTVQSGDSVRAGQLLMELENYDLRADLADLKQQRQIHAKRLRIHQSMGQFAEAQMEREKIDALEKQLQTMRRRVDGLQVRAAKSGFVVARDLQALLGRFVTEGDELLVLGSRNHKEIRVAIPEAEVETFRNWQHRNVEIRVRGRKLSDSTAELLTVYPSATRHLPHAALSAAASGPLDVMRDAGEDQQEVQLAAPHFEGIVRLPETLSQELFAGELCRVSVGYGRQTVLQKLSTLGRRYFSHKAAQATL